MTTAIVNKELNVADMAWQRALVRLHVDETTKQGQHNLARDRSMTSGRNWVGFGAALRQLLATPLAWPRLSETPARAKSALPGQRFLCSKIRRALATGRSRK